MSERDRAVWAEYEPIFRGATEQTERADLVGALRGLAPIDPGLPIIDYGTGSGTSMMALLDALPESRVIGVEPSRAFRAQLGSRLAAVESVGQNRWEIAPTLTNVGSKHPRWGLFVARNVLHLLVRAKRQRLVRQIARHLGGPVIVATPAYDYLARASYGELIAEVADGPLLYQRRLEWTRLRDGRFSCRNEFTVSREGAAVRRAVSRARVAPISIADFARPLAARGFTRWTDLGAGLFAFERRSDASG